MSTSEQMIDEQKSASLARIRDNQRRSRARRKEYLQELEERYRVCEQVGVEASAEMQAAARRVIEENRYLRTMLRQHGYTDTDIDRAVQEGTSATPAVANLDALFGKRRRPNITHSDSNINSSSNAGSSQGVQQSSSGSSSNQTPSTMTTARQMQQNHDPSQMNQFFPGQYVNAALSSSMGGPCLAQQGLSYNTAQAQQQWSTYDASNAHGMNIGSMDHHYENMPSIQSIKSEIGYGPQEEMDCQSTDAEYSMIDEQSYDMSNRYPR